jgi:hypothetical protein
VISVVHIVPYFLARAKESRNFLRIIFIGVSRERFSSTPRVTGIDPMMPQYATGCHVSQGMSPWTFGWAACGRFWTAPEGPLNPLLMCFRMAKVTERGSVKLVEG